MWGGEQEIEGEPAQTADGSFSCDQTVASYNHNVNTLASTFFFKSFSGQFLDVSLLCIQNPSAGNMT